jgi:PAS domain S-box-containing protein
MLRPLKQVAITKTVEPIRVLLVDDEETQIELTKLNLEKVDPNLTISGTTDPSQIFELLHQPYDCIVSDYSMRGMSGLKLNTEIKKTSNIPFILYTGRGSEEVAEVAFSVGIDDYVMKEHSLANYQVLARRIRNVVEKHRNEEEMTRLASYPLLNPNPIVEANFSGEIAYMNPSAKLVFLDLFEMGSISNSGLNWKETIAQIQSAERHTLVKDVMLGELWYSLSFHLVPSLDRIRFYATNIDERKRDEDTLFELNGKLLASNEELKKAEEDLKFSRDEVKQYANGLEIKVAERTKKLKESEETLRGFMDSAPDGFWVYSSKLELLDINRKALETIGSKREDVIGKSLTELEPGIQNEGRYDRVLRVMETGKTEYIDDFQSTSQSGEEWVDQWVFKIGDHLGIISRNITNRKNLEEKLRRAEQFDTVNRLGATVAHDLRSPLGAINNAVWVAKKKPEMVDKMLDIISGSVDRSVRMIDEFRAGTREVQVVKKRIDLSKLVMDVVDDVHVPESICVRLDVLEGFEAELDPDVFRRVLDNLVRNAVEAMSSGGRLTVSAHSEHDQIVVRVVDTGAGIREEDAKKLFEPMFTTKKKGLGLGLYYIRRAVEAHRGTIDFASKQGEGTTFTVKIPRK